MTRLSSYTGYARLAASFFGGDREAGADEFFQLGMNAYQDGALEPAERFLRRATSLAPERADLHASLGIILYDRGKLNDAAQAFNATLDLDPENTDALLGLGATLHAVGGVSDAIFYYLSYLRLEPTGLTAMLNLGAAFASTGQLDEAVEQFERAVQLQPENAEVYGTYGRSLYDAGRLDDAVPQLRLAVSKGSTDINVHRSLALALIARNDLAAAREVLEEAVQHHPDDVGARMDLSALLLDSGDPESAVEHAARATELADEQKDPTLRAHAYWQLGWARYRVGEWSKSAAASKTAVENDPSLVAPRFNLGVALFRTGDVTEARAQYEKALDLIQDPLDLKALGIKDLKAALADEPDPRGDEILARLEARYDELIDGRRSTLPVSS